MDAISKIKTEIPKSTGTLVAMIIDLADLATIKPAVEAFLKQENRLNVLIHNAGIMEPPAGSKTKLVSCICSFLVLSKSSHECFAR